EVQSRPLSQRGACLLAATPRDLQPAYTGRTRWLFPKSVSFRVGNKSAVPPVRVPDGRRGPRPSPTGCEDRMMTTARATPPTDPDAIDRRGMLRCMAWVGTGLVWSVTGGVASSRAFGRPPAPEPRPTFIFVQISDSHLGFARAPNKDVAGTLRQTVARINALPEPPAFVLHTGDVTHLAKPEEFDAVAEILKGVKAGAVAYVPGEHDFDGDGN